MSLPATLLVAVLLGMVPPGFQSPTVDPSGPGSALSAEVASVPSSSAELDAAELTVDRLVQRRVADTAALARAQLDLQLIGTELSAVTSLAARRDAQVDKAAAAAARTTLAVRALAVERFVTGGDVLEGLDPALTQDRRTELGRQRVLLRSGADQLVGDRRFTDGRLALLTAERNDMVARRDTLAEQGDELTRAVTELTASIERLGPQIVEAERSRQVAALSATIDGTDLSATSLDAYWRATQYVGVTDPECGLDWSSLAGIGRTESRHGTYRGALLGTDGEVAPPIYGPDLDGSNTFAVVPDSDGGVLDATSRTDRAVGPMQFLPSTWEVVGTDLTGDGTANPQNLFDAAASAAVYLCRSGPQLSDPARMRRAYLSYNRSEEYADIVTTFAAEYAEAVPLGRGDGGR